MEDSLYWKERFEKAEDAWQRLKSLTKRVPAGTWTPEYRELAEMIHSVGRDVFYIQGRANEPESTL